MTFPRLPRFSGLVATVSVFSVCLAMEKTAKSNQRASRGMKRPPQELPKKVFQDSVHGSIELHPLLVKIIDTPAFQRLRDIMQLGVSNLVFPSACHRRFEHSMGVSYLSAMMLEALERNSPEEMKKVTDVEKLCVQIAGLCHDLGHGPFSHVWEVFVANSGGVLEHEHMSFKILKKMLDENEGQLREEFEGYGLTEKDIELIGELINGKGKILDSDKQFLYEIVANKKTDIDVDKWDYFLRDGYALGFNVTFDYQRLLKFTKVARDDKTGQFCIVFRDKEKFSLEDMFRMRAELHTRAYQHHVSKKIEAMVIDALLEADPHFKFDGQTLKLSEAHTNTDLYMKMDDSVRQEIKRSKNPNLKTAKEIFDRIDRRQLYDDVGTFNVNYPEQRNDLSPKQVPARTFAEITKEVKEKFNANVRLIQILITSGKFREPTKKIKFYAKSEGFKTPRSAPVIQYNLPFSKIKVYCREDLSEDKKREIRQYCLAKLKEKGVLVEPEPENYVHPV